MIWNKHKTIGPCESNGVIKGSFFGSFSFYKTSTLYTRYYIFRDNLHILFIRERNEYKTHRNKLLFIMKLFLNSVVIIFNVLTERRTNRKGVEEKKEWKDGSLCNLVSRIFYVH